MIMSRLINADELDKVIDCEHRSSFEEINYNDVQQMVDEQETVEAILKEDLVKLLEKYMIFEKALEEIDDFYKELIRMCYSVLSKDLKKKYKVLIED